MLVIVRHASFELDGEVAQSAEPRATRIRVHSGRHGRLASEGRGFRSHMRNRAFLRFWVVDDLGINRQKDC